MLTIDVYYWKAKPNANIMADAIIYLKISVINNSVNQHFLDFFYLCNNL